MLETSARLLALLSLLQLRREWTGQELADRLEVGPRTIRRDVEKLRALGYPIEAERGLAGGYRLGRGGRMPPLLLDDAEAVAVAVGLRIAAGAAVAGIEETSVLALAKLEHVLPSRLWRRVAALAEATSAFGVDGPRVDPELLVLIANACQAATRLQFAYVGRDGTTSARHVEPSALVHSGYRWYFVAFDLDRDAWRTFRVDRIRGSVRLGRSGERRRVPGGDPARFVKEQLRSGEPEVARGRIRMAAPAAQVKARIPERWATIEASGDSACIVTSSGPWSQTFLVRVALLGVPIEVVGPPELAEAARTLLAGLTAAAPTT